MHPPPAKKPLIKRVKKLNLLFLSIGIILALFLYADPAWAQSVNIDFGQGSSGETTGRILQIIALITVLSIAPSLLVMVTSFTRIVVVLAFLRTALGLQQTPPNSVMVSLALFLTFFIMAPTFQVAYSNGIAPLIAEDITEEQAITEVISPFRLFMLEHVREQDLGLFMSIAKVDQVAEPTDIPTQALIPAFMISELRRAFEIGFLLFLPFLIIDLVIASILMSMGMMMLPPVMISLPFKIIFFVIVDGWYMLAGSLVQGFGVNAGL